MHLILEDSDFIQKIWFCKRNDETKKINRNLYFLK